MIQKMLSTMSLPVVSYSVGAAVHSEADGVGGLSGGAAGDRTRPRGTGTPQSHWDMFGYELMSQYLAFYLIVMIRGLLFNQEILINHGFLCLLVSLVRNQPVSIVYLTNYHLSQLSVDQIVSPLNIYRISGRFCTESGV